MSDGTDLPIARVQLLRLATRRESYFLCALVIFELVRLRISLWWIPSSDTVQWFVPWLQYIQAHGGFHALHDPIGEYFPMYFTLLASDSYLGRHMSLLGEVKLIPLVFDLFCAWMAYLIVQLILRNRTTRGEGVTLRATLAFIAVLALPSLLIDGAVWGQCDSYLIGFELATLYFLLRAAPARAIVCFGLAFAMKIQVLFLAPLLLVALLRGRVRWWQLLLLPAVWMASIVPALLAGRSLASTLSVFTAQTEGYPYLAINVANWWQWLRDMNFPYGAGVMIGLVAGVLAVGVLSYAGWKAKRLEPGWLLFFSATVLIIVPAVLPKMHDRYFLPATVFLVVLSCCDLRFVLPTVLLEVSNLLIYSNYFKQEMNRTTTDTAVLAAVVAVGLMVREMARTWRAGSFDEEFPVATGEGTRTSAGL